MSAETLARLEAVIAERKAAADAGSSHTARLLAGGPPKAARKFGEEAVEFVVAALAEDQHAVTAEAADVLYHFMVALAARDVPLAAVLAELDRRDGVSGLDEKAARGKT